MDRLIISGSIGKPEPELEKLLADAGVGEFFTADEARQFLSQNADASEIEIEIKSIGGDVVEGFEIYDMINSWKAKGGRVITIGQEYNSIASILFLAGDIRKHVSGASPLIHNSWQTPESLEGLRLNANTLRIVAEGNDLADQQMLHEYLKFAGRENISLIKELMGAETKLTDNQVMDLGFATEIIQGPKNRVTAKALSFNSALIPQAKMYADVLAYSNGQVLMIQRSLSDSFEAGKWAFPGGKIEQGEEPALAAVRELKEETGYDLSSPEFIESVQNDDGSITFYFTGEIEGEYMPDAKEVADMKFISEDQLDELKVIKDQSDRYKSIISKTNKMSKELTEKVGILESGINSLLAIFAPKKKAMTLPLADGAELYIFSEDGEVEGKRAVIAENGQPTDTAAPVGNHPLGDGRTITVGEGGIIESVSEAAAAAPEADKPAPAAMTEEEMNAKIAAMQKERDQALSASSEMTEKMNALQAQLAKGEESNAKLIQGLQALKLEVATLKEEVPGDNPATKSNKKAMQIEKEQKAWGEMTTSQKLQAQIINQHFADSED